MRTYETQTRQVGILIDVACDACGASTKVSEGGMTSFDYATVKPMQGYLNSYDDDREWAVELCIPCFRSAMQFLKVDLDEARKGKTNED